MTPLTIAEKWTRSALVLHEQWDTRTPEAETLSRRLVAHYGLHHHVPLHQIVAVAMLEAIKEWEAHP